MLFSIPYLKREKKNRKILRVKSLDDKMSVQTVLVWSRINNNFGTRHTTSVAVHDTPFSSWPEPRQGFSSFLGQHGRLGSGPSI